MKSLMLFIVAVVAAVAMKWEPTKVANDNRDYEYEAYCDSIYEVDPDYYNDVLVETDAYQNYIELNGQWWAE